jgi:hypothetical protein
MTIDVDAQSNLRASRTPSLEISGDADWREFLVKNAQSIFLSAALGE